MPRLIRFHRPSISHLLCSHLRSNSVRPFSPSHFFRTFSLSHFLTLFPCLLAVVAVAGCSGSRSGVVAAAPDVAPSSQPADIAPLKLETSQIKPLHRELLAIDLAATLRAAAADNLEIQTARQ